MLSKDDEKAREVAQEDGEEQATEVAEPETQAEEVAGAPAPAQQDGSEPEVVEQGPAEAAHEPSIQPTGEGAAPQVISITCPACEMVNEGTEKPEECVKCGLRFRDRDVPDAWTDERPPIRLRPAQVKSVSVVPGEGGGDVLKIGLEVTSEDPLISYQRVKPYKGKSLDLVLVPEPARSERPHPEQRGFDEAVPEQPPIMYVPPARIDELTDAECGDSLHEDCHVPKLVAVNGRQWAIVRIASSRPVIFEAWQAMALANHSGDSHTEQAKGLDGLEIVVGAPEDVKPEDIERTHVLFGPAFRIVAAEAEHTEGDPESIEIPRDRQEELVDAHCFEQVSNDKPVPKLIEHEGTLYAVLDVSDDVELFGAVALVPAGDYTESTVTYARRAQDCVLGPGETTEEVMALEGIMIEHAGQQYVMTSREVVFVLAAEADETKAEEEPSPAAEPMGDKREEAAA